MKRIDGTFRVAQTDSKVGTFKRFECMILDAEKNPEKNRE